MTGMIKGFLGVKIFRFQDFFFGGGGVGKFGKYFFGWVDLRRDFWEY